MEVPGSPSNESSGKAAQLQDDQKEGQDQAPTSPSPTVHVTSEKDSEDLQACGYNNPVDNPPCISQVPPDFRCQSTGNPDDQCNAYGGASCLHSPSNQFVTFYIPDEFRDCMSNLEDTSKSLEKELFEATVRLEEQKAVFTGLKNLYVSQEMKVDKQEREIGDLEAQVEMQKRLVLNQIIHKKMIESMIADTDKFVADTKTFLSHQDVADIPTSEANCQHENLEGLAGVNCVVVSNLGAEEFQKSGKIATETGTQPEVSSARELEPNKLKSSENAVTVAEYADFVKELKSVVSFGKKVANKLTSSRLEMEMEARALASTTHSPSSDDEWVDVSSSCDEEDVETQDIETTRVSTESKSDPISTTKENA